MRPFSIACLEPSGALDAYPVDYCSHAVAPSIASLRAPILCCGHRYELQLVVRQQLPSICHALTLLQPGSNSSKACQLAAACHGRLQVQSAVYLSICLHLICCIVQLRHLGNA